MIDFTQEKEVRFGPVPEGSYVICSIVKIKPGKFVSQTNPLVSMTSTGLLRLEFEVAVVKGAYSGCKFFDFIYLPLSQQPQASIFSEGQIKCCRIGGWQFKALLMSAKRQAIINNYTDLVGLKFAAKLKLGDKADKEGRWYNKLDRIITPENNKYVELQQKGELINEDGAIVGTISSPDQMQYDYSDEPSFQDQPPAQPQQPQPAPAQSAPAQQEYTHLQQPLAQPQQSAPAQPAPAQPAPAQPAPAQQAFDSVPF